MRKHLLLLACLALAPNIHAQTEIKGTPENLAAYLTGVPKTVTLTGDGEIKKTADRAVIMLKISTENKSLQEAMRLNQDIRAKVQEQLKNGGIAAEHVQAAKFASTPQFGWFSDKAKSYKIENSVKVTVSGEKEFQAVSGAVDKYPEVQFLNVEFEHANKEELKKQVVAKACDNVNERRKLYEEKLGVRLVPKAFAEGSAAAQLVTGRDRNYGSPVTALSGVLTDPAYRVSVHALEQRPTELADGVSPFGELTYKTQVAVEYTVETK